MRFVWRLAFFLTLSRQIRLSRGLIVWINRAFASVAIIKIRSLLTALRLLLCSPRYDTIGVVKTLSFVVGGWKSRNSRVLGGRAGLWACERPNFPFEEVQPFVCGNQGCEFLTSSLNEQGRASIITASANASGRRFGHPLKRGEHFRQPPEAPLPLTTGLVIESPSKSTTLVKEWICSRRLGALVIAGTN